MVLDSCSDGFEPKAAPTVFVGQLGSQRQVLVDLVEEANTPGNLEGLFAHHVLEGSTGFSLTWNVNPATPTWIDANAERLTQAPILAALGYGLRHFRATVPDSAYTGVTGGLQRLKRREPFPADRVSFAFNPVMFLGVALAVEALDGAAEDVKGWLVTILDDPRCRSSEPFQMLLYGYIRYLLTGESRAVDDIRPYQGVGEFALLEWGSRHGALRLVDQRGDLSQVQGRVLSRAVGEDLSRLGAARAAVVWSAVQAALTRSVDELVLSRSHVSNVLRRFEAAMRRWRWDDLADVRHPVRWEIVGEREVQDILWLVLGSIFEDVVDEETLPKVGHSTYRADFGIPSLRLLIEAKYARKAADFKNLEKEIMEDSVAYLLEARDRYDRITVFIYDESASVQEHEVTASALRRLPSIDDVVIVSRPSQLVEVPTGSKPARRRMPRARRQASTTQSADAL